MARKVRQIRGKGNHIGLRPVPTTAAPDLDTRIALGRMAASAEDMTVPSARANGTIVSGPLGTYLVATSAGRNSFHWCKSWWIV